MVHLCKLQCTIVPEVHLFPRSSSEWSSLCDLSVAPSQALTTAKNINDAYDGRAVLPAQKGCESEATAGIVIVIGVIGIIFALAIGCDLVFRTSQPESNLN